MRILDKLPAEYRLTGWGKDWIKISTGAADRRKAGVEHARIVAEVESRIEVLRAGPRTLPWEAAALAGEVHRAPPRR